MDEKTTHMDLVDAINAAVVNLKRFTPGQRGVIIGAAQNIIGVLEAKADLSNYALYGIKEDEDNG